MKAYLELENEHLCLSVAEEFAQARKRNRRRRQQAIARQRRYEEALEARGRCRRCPQTAEPGKLCCAACLAKEAARVSQYYARRRAG